jgi:hypothetical protein
MGGSYGGSSMTDRETFSFTEGSAARGVELKSMKVGVDLRASVVSCRFEDCEIRVVKDALFLGNRARNCGITLEEGSLGGRNEFIDCEVADLRTGDFDIGDMNVST